MTLTINTMDATCLSAAEELVRKHMAQYDPSHDYAHVDRVRKFALKIAKTLGPTVDLFIVELAALFHDMADAKYTTKPLSETLKDFFAAYLTPEQRDLIIRVVDSISWSTEKKLRAGNQWSSWHDTCLELHAVQDADRLDAIGAIGVFRAAAYGSIRGSPLLGMDGTEGHFHEKLLLIKSRIKTPAGHMEATRRHDFMVAFLAELELERVE